MKGFSTTGPEFEPLTLAELRNAVKQWSDVTADDDLLQYMQTAAREWLENATGQRFMKQTVIMSFDSFDQLTGDVLSIYTGPVLEISSVKYYNDNGDDTTLDSATYSVDTTTKPARILFNDIPSIDTDRLGGIRVEMVCGYSTSALESEQQTSVPQRVKQAIRYLVTTWYQRREDWYDGETLSLPQRAWSLASQLQYFRA